MNKTISQSSMNLSEFYRQRSSQTLKERARNMSNFVNQLKDNNELSYHRIVVSPADRHVEVYNDSTRKTTKMLMFGSNNYLGFANHPYVQNKVKEAISRYGIGIGGPPLLNGNTLLKEELEERLAHLKDKEDTIIYPSGYAANLGMISSLAQSGDMVIFDSNSHASFYDGLRLSKAKGQKFIHNDLDDLELKLELANLNRTGELFIGIEGVYSMDGDLSPLNKIIALAEKYNATTILDDAHGTCVLGECGSGTAEHFNIASSINVTMGTFSKSFAMSGGFVSSSKEIIDYLKYSSRPYMFSASLPPATYAAVLAGLDLLESEPWLREQLHDNAKYAKSRLRKFGFSAEPEAAIISIKVPDWMNIRKANHFLHNQGLFVNAIEYPAVPKEDQRFRLSLMAQHTKSDVDRLTACFEYLWANPEL